MIGLLEAREKKVREEVARLRAEAERVQAALDAAEHSLNRLADARAMVAEVLAAEQTAPAAGPPKRVVPGRIVPPWSPGIDAGVLAVEYQRILSILSAAPDGGLRVPEILGRIGGEVTASRLEGVRARVRRLADRGWVREVTPNVFGRLTTETPAVAG
ncbi:hypothetical protein ACFYQA_32695 [Streptomyces sp. NPDC005774]|uniref:hypothetical protein n=1 Tax=Streptomyces sp. NPDC005774 TaxID=3364728 RepID=UPI00368C8283